MAPVTASSPEPAPGLLPAAAAAPPSDRPAPPPAAADDPPARPRHVEILLFLACNGTAAGINFGSRILLSQVLPYGAAICLAYLCGMLTAFTLSRVVVFRATRGPVGQQLMWFALVNGAAIVQTLAVSLLLARVVFPAVRMAWRPETVAHAVGIVVPVVSSYFGHKRLSFARRA